jgi:Tol biopolymer transport system component
MDAAWSPDGQWILYRVCEGATESVWVSLPDGSGTRRVAAGGADVGFGWSPDGRSVVVSDGTDPLE